MALGEIGMFLPGEAQYTKPGTYDQALRAEATKSAVYLSSMDQFYANLEEAKSEFGQTLAFKEKQLAQEGALGGRGLDIQEEQVALNREELAWRKQYQEGQLDYQNSELQAGIDLSQKRLDQLNEAQDIGGTHVPAWDPRVTGSSEVSFGPRVTVPSVRSSTGATASTGVDTSISQPFTDYSFAVSPEKGPISQDVNYYTNTDPWADLNLYNEDMTFGY